MLDEYKYISKEDYNLVENPTVFAVNPKIVDIISVLNKKGYYTLSSYIRLDIFSARLLNKIINANILRNSDERKVIAEIADGFDSNLIRIIFDKEYDFVLPKEFNKVKSELLYVISPIKTVDGVFNAKSIREIEQEMNQKLDILRDWANELPDFN